MNLIGRTSLVLAALTVLVPRATGVTCYSCTSVVGPVDSGSCDDTFVSTNVSTCEGGYCTKTKLDTIGVVTVARSCGLGTGSNKCDRFSLFGVVTYSCDCSTDNCNTAASSTAGYFLFPVAIMTTWCMM